MPEPSSDPPGYSERAPPGHSTRANSESDSDSNAPWRKRGNNDFVNDVDTIAQWSELLGPGDEGGGNQGSDETDTFNQPRSGRGGRTRRGSPDSDHEGILSGPRPRQNQGGGHLDSDDEYTLSGSRSRPGRGRGHRDSDSEDMFSQPRPRQDRGRGYQDSDSEDMYSQPHPRRSSGRGGRDRDRDRDHYDEPPTRQAGPRLNFGNQRLSRQPPPRQVNFANQMPSRHPGHHSPQLDLEQFAAQYSAWRDHTARQLREHYYVNYVPNPLQTFPPKFRSLYGVHRDTGVELPVLRRWAMTGVMEEFNCGSVRVDYRSISRSHSDMLHRSTPTRRPF